ncbi:MAG: hypothetical protein ABR561_04245 [Guyparkeria sp.]
MIQLLDLNACKRLFLSIKSKTSEKEIRARTVIDAIDVTGCLGVCARQGLGQPRDRRSVRAGRNLNPTDLETHEQTPPPEKSLTRPAAMGKRWA